MILAIDILYRCFEEAESLRILKLDCVSITNEALATIGRNCNYLQQLSIKISYPSLISDGIEEFVYKDYPVNKMRNPICSNLKCLAISTVCSRMLVRSFVTNVDFYVDAVDAQIKGSGEVRHNGHLLGTLDESTVSYFRYDNAIYVSICTLVENISSLKEFIYVRAGRVMVQLVTEGRNYPKELEYIHDSLSSDETIEILSSACPQLKNLWIEFTNSCAFLPNLQKFRYLTILKIDGDTSTDEFEPFLCNCGASITQLTIGNVKGTVDLHLISEKCPLLENLALTATSYCYTGRNVFENLEKLSLGSDWPNTSRDCTALCHLLFDIPNIRSLEFSPGHNFNDELVGKIVTSCPLSSLERLIIQEGYNITLKSYQSLVDHCPLLSVLGNSNYIQNFVFELAFLKEKMKNQNIYIKFIQDTVYLGEATPDDYTYSSASSDEEDSFG